jgi:hypothetical protein
MMEASTVARQLLEFLQGFDGLTAYGVILGMLLACGLGVPMPEDITLLGAGILAGVESISLPGAIIVGFFGVLAGDAFFIHTRSALWTASIHSAWISLDIHARAFGHGGEKDFSELPIRLFHRAISTWTKGPHLSDSRNHGSTSNHLLRA